MTNLEIGEKIANAVEAMGLSGHWCIRLFHGDLTFEVSRNRIDDGQAIVALYDEDERVMFAGACKSIAEIKLAAGLVRPMTAEPGYDGKMIPFPLTN